MIVSSGSILKPVVEVLSYADTTGIIKAITANGATKDLNKDSNSKTAASKSTFALVGPAQAKLPHVVVKDDEKTSVSVTEATTVATTEATVEEKVVGEEEQVGGPSFGELLSKTGRGALGTKSGSAQPKANSMEQILEQALRTQDETLLSKVFNTTDEQIIQTTIEKLPSTFVVPFLQESIKKFHSNPYRSMNIARWIRHLLLTHTSLLITNKHLGDLLSPFYGTLEGRLAVFPELLKLQGRMDLLVSQIGTKKNYNSALTQGPITTYDEAVKAPSGSEVGEGDSGDDSSGFDDEDDEDMSDNDGLGDDDMDDLEDLDNDEDGLEESS